jgi:hypothetical protein
VPVSRQAPALSCFRGYVPVSLAGNGASNNRAFPVRDLTQSNPGASGQSGRFPSVLTTHLPLAEGRDIGPWNPRDTQLQITSKDRTFRYGD